MPCDRADPTPQGIIARGNALDRLQRALAAGEIGVFIGPQGSIAFPAWKKEDRAGLSDLCAYRKLVARNSPELRRAVARAEAIFGRKLDPRAINAGVHSHDGGLTWGHH